MPGSHKFAILAGERAVVHREFHLIVGGSIGLEGSAPRSGVSQRVSPMKTSSETRKTDDVTGVSFGNLNALQALEMVNGGDFARRHRPST